MRISWLLMESFLVSTSTSCWTRIAPVVSVPVLSNTTVSIFGATSRTATFRRMMPRFAPRPEATKSATGVASPSAQGQAITKTATAAAIEGARSFPSAIQVERVAIAIKTTIGTKTPLIRSATRWIGAFSAWAASTILVIRDNSVSEPTRFASIMSRLL